MKNTLNIFKTATAFLITFSVLSSCGSDNLVEYLENPGGEKDPVILNLTWDNYENGIYKEEDAKKDFGSLTKWNNRININNKALEVKLLAGKVSGDGGVVTSLRIPEADEYRLSFDVLFPEDFIWSRGGKVGFGLLIGDGNTGGDKADDGNGGSARMMWYTSDNGETRFKPYLYYKDMPGQFGDNFVSAAAYPTSGSLEKGKWYNIVIHTKSNTGDLKNGHITYLVDGHIVLDEDIRWTTNDVKRLINQLTFSTFRGGSQDYWKTDVDTYLKLDNLKLEKLGQSYIGPNSKGEIYPEASQTSILKGKSVVFSDYSTRVISRQWTFEGGSPNTSTINKVEVAYEEAGEYAAKLDVTFEDGSTKSETIIISVTKEYVPLVSVDGATFVLYSEDQSLPQDYPTFTPSKSGVGVAKFVSAGFEGMESINLSVDPDKSGTFAMLQITGKGTFDLRKFRNGYLNLALKSTNEDPVNVRIDGGGATSHALVAPGDYGFDRDGQWHFISIPMEDVLSKIDTEEGKMSLLQGFDQFRYRNEMGKFNKSTFDHSLDFIFFSEKLPILNQQ